MKYAVPKGTDSFACVKATNRKPLRGKIRLYFTGNGFRKPFFQGKELIIKTYRLLRVYYVVPLFIQQPCSSLAPDEARWYMGVSR